LSDDVEVKLSPVETLPNEDPPAPAEDPPAVPATVEAPPSARFRRLWPHTAILPVLAAAVALRVYFLHTYPYAFFFSDSRAYVGTAAAGMPFSIRPYGYSWLLRPFVDDPHIGVAVAQHLAGMAIIPIGYAFLVHRKVRPWLAALAMVPFALDAREITLEHYVLAETAFVVATGAGLFLLAWRNRLGWVAAALGGLTLSFAALTRTVGLPVLALVAAYLLVRRVGWLRLVAFALPVVAVLGGYMSWYHQYHGVYAFGQYQGRFLYARVMPIADCSRLKLTAKQRTLCMPDAPADWKQRPDQYIWSPISPSHRYASDSNDKFLGDFAKAVIKQEPVAYLLMIADETSWHLRLHAPVTGMAECLTRQWLPPATAGTSCVPRYYLPTPTPQSPPPQPFLVTTADTRWLQAYGKIATTPGPLYAIGVVVALFAAVWRPRRRSWRDAADGLLFVGAGFALIVISVATSLFDYRYAVPAVLLIPIGMALSITRLTTPRTTSTTEPRA
jgi:hypothetical protein